MTSGPSFGEICYELRKQPELSNLEPEDLKKLSPLPNPDYSIEKNVCPSFSAMRILDL